jgi:hypothetical protein
MRVTICLFLASACAMFAQGFGQSVPLKAAARLKPAAGGGGWNTDCASIDDASLQAYWRLDEASGTRSDTKGSNHLTDNNTVTAAAGIIGNCAEFTKANNESLTVADSAAVSGGDFDWSMSVWIKLKSKSTSMGIVSKWNSGGNEWILFYDPGSDRFRFIWGGTLVANALGAPALDTWYHVVITHNTATDILKIRVNDNNALEDVQGSGGAFPADGTSPLEIGSYSSANFFDGFVDELLITKKVLSATEITKLYFAGAGCRPSGL